MAAWIPAAFAKLSSLLQYIDGDYRDPATFTRVREALGPAARPLHYLAIPPSMFADGHGRTGPSRLRKDARVVVEKPFGRDLASAQELNRTLHRSFPESAIFRIDHYLGKEPVLNLIYFRFANPLFEAGWNSEHLESIQITMAEQFGVEGRGKFYEEVGAIRDVVQNHMLQVVACLAMGRPTCSEHEALRDQRGELLRAMRRSTPPTSSAASSGLSPGARRRRRTRRSRRSRPSSSTSRPSDGRACRFSCGWASGCRSR